MLSTPLISILIPVYNAGPFVKQALDSVLAQTYGNFEVLLINDGSTDNSQEVIATYRDPRLISISQSNSGVARTLNRGISLARGEYIWRHDADDTSVPYQLEAQLRFLQNHPNITLVGTQMGYMTARGKYAHRMCFPANDYFDKADYRVINSIGEIIKYRPVVHATVLVRRDALLRVGGYREEFLTSEDYDLWLRMVEIYPLAVMKMQTYFVRLHLNSACQRNWSSIQYYMDLATQLAYERQKTGNDLLQNGRPLPPGVPTESISGRLHRKDLQLLYRTAYDAEDWITFLQAGWLLFRNTWRTKKGWQHLVAPFFSRP